MYLGFRCYVFNTLFLSDICSISVKKTLIEGPECFPTCLLEAFIYIINLFFKNKGVYIVIRRITLPFSSVGNLSLSDFQSWLQVPANTPPGCRL